MRRLLIVVPLLIGCQTQRGPSATEIFNLRQRCADVGKKYVAEQNDRLVLVQMNREAFSSPHYNVKDNRCYVSDSKWNDGAVAFSLSATDAQTGEQDIVEAVEYFDGRKEGQINGGNAPFKQALQRIKEMMEDNSNFPFPDDDK